MQFPESVCEPLESSPLKPVPETEQDVPRVAATAEKPLPEQTEERESTSLSKPSPAKESPQKPQMKSGSIFWQHDARGSDSCEPGLPPSDRNGKPSIEDSRWSHDGFAELEAEYAVSEPVSRF